MIEFIYGYLVGLISCGLILVAKYLTKSNYQKINSRESNDYDLVMGDLKR